MLLAFQAPISILGISLFGWPAVLAKLLLTFLSFYLFWGLWSLREKARRMTIWYAWLAILSILLTAICPTTKAQMEVVAGHAMGHAINMPPNEMLPLMTASVLSAVVQGVFVWFLIKRKSAFAGRTLPQSVPSV